MKAKGRIWELDLAKFVAIAIMIIAHTIYDLVVFYGVDVPIFEGFFATFGVFAMYLFIGGSGVSSTLSRSNLSRGVKVFLVGMVFTLVTYLYDKDFVIVFGILHFLGISMILYHFLRNTNSYVLFAIIVVIIGLNLGLRDHIPTSNILFPLGIVNRSFSSADYFPMIPWFAVYLGGILIGRHVYKDRQSLFGFELKCPVISWVSKRSLIIYVLHQPIILGVLFLVMR